VKRIFVGTIWGDEGICRWIVCLICGYVAVVGVRHAKWPLFRHFLILFVL